MTTPRPVKSDIIGKCAISLIILIACLLAADLFLVVVDPLGAHAYADDNARLASVAFPDAATGYMLAPGTHYLTRSVVTIGRDGRRIVPDTDSEADCTIAALGDSITFGFGVNDDATWVNQLARLYPDVRFINTAYSGYNSDNIRGAYENTIADGYVYLIINNDTGYPAVWEPNWRDKESLTGVAAYLAMASRQSRPRWPAFEEDMRVIFDGDVLAFTFQEYELAAWLQDRYPQTIALPFWTSNNSRADNHPDRTGHTQIANSMVGHFDSWIEGVCYAHA